MVQKLEVRVGAHRFAMDLADVNGAPTEIETDKFVGRVLVRVRDFTGITPDGSKPKQDPAYFAGRSRKFAVLIEGRWKHREGVEPYTGDEVQFGSDFDFLPANFPRNPFNIGMKIAHYVDEANSWCENPPHGRPYIMSPYTACMTSFCAYPAPNALSRALLLAHHDSTHPHHEGEEQEGGIVPISDKSGNRPYWRFVGLTGHPPVDSFLKSHAHLMSPASSRSSSPAAGAPVGENDKPRLNLRKLGTDSSLRETAMAGGSSTPTTENFRPFGSPVSESVEGEVEGGDWGAVISKRDTTDGPEQEARVAAALEKAEKEKVAKPKKSRFSLATLRSVLERTVDVEVLHVGDLQTGNNIKQDERGAKAGSDALDAQLGPWRFGEEGVDVLEDSTFVFLDPTHSRTVAARRKHFCVDNGKNRKSFKYDPDVIYAASFFSNFCDLNSFDLTMGPLKMNIAEYFRSQPIRYTLRSKRLAPRPDGSEGPEEEEVFATISFQMVEVAA